MFNCSLNKLFFDKSQNTTDSCNAIRLVSCDTVPRNLIRSSGNYGTSELVNCVFVISIFPLENREKDHKFKFTIASRNQQMVYEGKKYFSHFLDLFESLIGTGRVRSRPSMTQEVRVTGSENNSRVPQGTEWGHLVKHFPVLNFTPGSTPWRRPMVTRCFWWSLLEVIQYSPPPCNLEFVRSLCFSPDIQIGKRDARAPRSFSSLIAVSKLLHVWAFTWSCYTQHIPMDTSNEPRTDLFTYRTSPSLHHFYRLFLECLSSTPFQKRPKCARPLRPLLFFRKKGSYFPHSLTRVAFHFWPLKSALLWSKIER